MNTSPLEDMFNMSTESQCAGKSSRKAAPRVGAPLVLELCAGGGGQTLGLELAGFQCAGAIEIDSEACATLRLNRPDLRVLQEDLRCVSASEFGGIDLLAGGVPCPPFSIAGRQLGSKDERDLFPEALRIVEETLPKAVMFENVRGLGAAKFAPYREWLRSRLRGLGYEAGWSVVNASDHGVPQLRPRFIMVALQTEFVPFFRWPSKGKDPLTVGRCLAGLMGERGWPGVLRWVQKANRIAPTIVGGSKKHGGPDLGPTRAREEWRKLGVNGLSIAEESPCASFPTDAHPRLTNRMVAQLQGFPDTWKFAGSKTAQYRQIGNAFPPPVACAVAKQIRSAIGKQAEGEPRLGGGELFESQLVAGA